MMTPLDPKFHKVVALMRSTQHEGERAAANFCDGEAARDPSARDGQIRAALDADPSRSDRAIARNVGCSPTIVGKVRSAMGLSTVDRSVQRRGQIYAMRTRAAGAPT